MSCNVVHEAPRGNGLKLPARRAVVRPDPQTYGANAEAVTRAGGDEGRAVAALTTRDSFIPIAESGHNLPAQQQPMGLARDRYWQACIAAQLGDVAGAMTLLREAMAFAPGALYRDVHLEPALDPLRGDPSFRQLLRPRG